MLSYFIKAVSEAVDRDDLVLAAFIAGKGR
jgi:hypothetical protein